MEEEAAVEAPQFREAPALPPRKIQQRSDGGRMCLPDTQTRLTQTRSAGTGAVCLSVRGF